MEAQKIDSRSLARLLARLIDPLFSSLLPVDPALVARLARSHSSRALFLPPWPPLLVLALRSSVLTSATSRFLFASSSVCSSLFFFFPANLLSCFLLFSFSCFILSPDLFLSRVEGSVWWLCGMDVASFFLSSSIVFFFIFFFDCLPACLPPPSRSPTSLLASTH